MAVRREVVQLDIEGSFVPEALRAAAAVKTLEGSLRDLDGTSVSTSRSINRVATDNDRLSTSAVRGSQSIDKFSGRLGILLKVAATLGPALVPLGAVGVAGVAGLANQFGFAAIAAGTAVIAFQGVGDALEAVNDAALDPTVDNLQKAHDALVLLSPAAREMVGALQEMRPLLEGLRDSAAEAMFPGLIQGFDELQRAVPAVDAILVNVGSTIGDLFAEGSASLASPRWADFFAVLARDARPVLTDMAHAIGDVAHGLSELWEAFMPLNRDFGSWLADAANGFDRWASGLSRTEGFQEFVSYLRENGPKVAEATTAIANALLQIVEAAAPLGGPVLDAITTIAEAIGAIADSPLGTPIMAAVTALSAMSLAANVATAALLRLRAAQAAVTAGGGAAAASGGAAAAGPLGVAGLVGVLNIPDFIDNLGMMVDGERGVVEGLGRMVAAATPTGAVLQAFGVDILGTADGADTLATRLARTAREQQELADATNVTRGEVQRFSGSFFDANQKMLRTARQVSVLEEQIGESNKTIHEAASEWFDFSQKVELGNTSLDTVIDRMRTLATAAANEAQNIQKALRRGVDPQVIQSLYDTLGPQGAVLALDQLAHATRGQRDEVERVFGTLHRGEQDVERAMRGVNEAITGSREKLRDLNREKVEPKAELDDTGLRGGVVSAERLLTGLDQKNPHPKADVDIGGVQNGVASATRLLLGFDGRTATATITTYHRDIYQQLGNNNLGGRAPLASGGTVNGQRYPYRDRVPAILAPGEEVISNRYGQADRHRALLKAINANRYASGGTIRGERAMLARMSTGGTTRQVIEVRVTGEMDLNRAKAQITELSRSVTRGEIDQHITFAESQR